MEFHVSNFRGEIAAIAGASLWAISANVYSFVGTKIPPLLLNLIKGLIAIAFILLTFILTNYQFSSVNMLSIVGLTISGIAGIGIGDTAFFQALNHLGARKTLLLETLTPPLTAILAFIFIDEKLNSTIWMGMIITITGIAWVISERNPEIVTEKNQQMVTGVKWALIAVISQAIGAVIARYSLLISEISSLESSLIRLFGGTIIVLLLMTPQKKTILPLIKEIWSIKLGLIITVTAFVSTYLGIWLQQTAFKFAPVGIAQTLLATSPLFVLPIVFVFGEKISYRSIIGAIIALLGVSLLFT
jgi:drug/metabolite transporter (DMT)-like permease